MAETLYTMTLIFNDNNKEVFEENFAYFSTKEKAKDFLNECGYTKEIETKYGLGYFPEMHSKKSDIYSYVIVEEKEIDREDTEFELLKGALKAASLTGSALGAFLEEDKQSVEKVCEEIRDTTNTIGICCDMLILEKEHDLKSISGMFDNINSVEDL